MVQAQVGIKLCGFFFAVQIDKLLPAVRVAYHEGGFEFQVKDFGLEAQGN